MVEIEMTEGANTVTTCLHFKETPSLTASSTLSSTLRNAGVENQPGRLRDAETQAVCGVGVVECTRSCQNVTEGHFF